MIEGGSSGDFMLPDAVACQGQKPEEQVAQAEAPEMGFFEKYLSVWVLLCMIIGGLIGAYRPEVAEALGQAQFAEINAIVAVLLWLMILPMLIQINFASLVTVKEHPGAILLTTGINYLVMHWRIS
jgi:arsenite transporter